MNSPRPDRAVWKEWTLDHWNDALFRHVFEAGEDDSSPVTRVVLTDEEFGRVIGDSTQPPGVVRECFRDAVLECLQSSGLTLLGHAKSSGLAQKGRVPAYFAHLVVTCIAGTWDTDPTRPDGEFRRRLSRFLNRDGNNYWLNDLPELWEGLREWLDAAIDEGASYRRLILRRQSHLRIIGYSLELAFPSLKDTAALVSLFSREGIVSPPSVPPVSRAVQGNLHEFGERFRTAFEEFERAIRERDPYRYRCPFWSVVLEAARLAVEEGEPSTRPRAKVELVLEFGPDGSSRVVPFLGSRPTSAPPPPHVLLEDHYRSVDGYPFVLETEPPISPARSAGGLTLAKRLSSLVPDATTKDLDRIIGEGVLLFGRSENQSWILCRTRPVLGEVKGLIRSDIGERFLEAVRARGGNPLGLSSPYTGWIQVDRLLAEELPLGEWCPGRVGCLDETVTTPRISLCDGVIVPGGWLGLRASLPRVLVDAESVTIEPVVDPAPPLSAEVTLRPESDGAFSIPEVPSLERDLLGRFRLRARHEKDVLAVRTISFRPYASGHDYCLPSDCGRWLVESGCGDLKGLPSAELPSWESHASELDDGVMPPCLDPNHLTASYSGAEDVRSVVEILAAVGQRRQGIDEADLIEWARRALGVDGPPVWDVIRSWVESGFLECTVYRHWKKRSYFPRRPRLVIYRRRGGTFLNAVVLGLLPSLSRQQLEEVAQRRGARLGYRPQRCLGALPLPLLEAPSVEILDELRTTCELAPSEMLPPLESCAGPVGSPGGLSERPAGYESAGVWDWTEARFVQGTRIEGPSLERLIRVDAPDIYVVNANGQDEWVGWSRTWGFLTAANAQRRKIFESGGASSLRIVAEGVHLPVPLARWACATTGICPGAIGCDPASRQYVYDFPTSHPIRVVERLLFGREETLRWTQKASWLITAMAARVRTTDRLVSIPADVRAVFLDVHGAPALRQLGQTNAVPLELLPLLLALKREIEYEVRAR